MRKKTFDIPVLQRHIDEGCQMDHGHCPVALAFKDVFPKVSVSVSSFYVTLKRYNKTLQFDFDQELRRGIFEFDNKRVMKPFVVELFDLTLEELDFVERNYVPSKES